MPQPGGTDTVKSVNLMSIPNQEPQAPAPKRRHEPFRVCTVDDFGLEQRDNVRRPFGRTSATACRMCRLRKVKCVDSNTSRRRDGRGRCQPCQSADLACQWNTIDKRRRRTMQAQERVATQDAMGSYETSETEPWAGEEGPATTPSPHQAGNPVTRRNSEDGGKRSNIPTVVVNHPRFTPPQTVPGPITGEALPSQPFFAEICPEGTMQMQSIPEWANLGDYVLGLDFMDDHDNLDMGAHPTFTFSPGELTGVHPQGSETRRVVKLRYYRRFGPTAVVPGLRKLALVLDSAEREREQEQAVSNWQQPDPARILIPSPQASISSPGSISNDRRLFDPTSRKPQPEIMSHVLDVFFKQFGDHFPFLHPQILDGHVRSQEASSFLLNAITALTVRFCSADGPLAVLGERYESEWQRGAPFLLKAKEQLMPLLSIPAPEVVAGLVILAWAEFGDSNETGLWMFAGMAIRMAQDLGFHRAPVPDVDPDISFHDHARPSPDGSYILTDEQSTIHQEKARLVMFWSVFVLDVCVSLVTGRPPTIRRSEIEVPVPSYSDMKLAQLDLVEEVTAKNMLFPATIGLMLNVSEAVELLNRMSPDLAPEPASTGAAGSGLQASLKQARETLAQQYRTLPQELVFSIENFKASTASTQSGLFLILHLFYYTVLTLLSNNHSRDARYGLNYARSRRPSAVDIFNTLAQQASASSCGRESRLNTTVVPCQKIVQLLLVAELVDSSSYLASPFTNHCLFVAASTLLQDMQTSREENDDSVFSPHSKEDYVFLYRKLQDQATYFGGIRSVVAVLEHKYRKLFEAGDLANSEEDSDDGVHRVAAVDDPGIVNRYSIPEQRTSGAATPMKSKMKAKGY